MRRKSILGLLLAGLAMGAASSLKAADGQDTRPGDWAQLFNGKDLTGWKSHPGDKAVWQVVDGNLVGSGPSGHLFSVRGDYENFHFRIDAKISDQGNSGQYFRATFARGFPPGYEAQINATSGDPIRTGSLYPDQYSSDDEKQRTIVHKQLVKPNDWFTQEVIAVGNHIVIRLNGQITVDFVDVRKRYGKGHFAFQQHHAGSVITVRKAEVKELP